jgi:hypothetical protein
VYWQRLEQSTSQTQLQCINAIIACSALPSGHVTMQEIGKLGEENYHVTTCVTGLVSDDKLQKMSQTTCYILTGMTEGISSRSSYKTSNQ